MVPVTWYQATLTLDDLRQRFILAFPENETPFLLTYTAARLRNLGILPPHATRNAFAGQVELNVLFDIATVIETAIKAKRTNPCGHFKRHAEYLLVTMAHPLTGDQLGAVNEQFNLDFDRTIRAARDGTLTLQDGARLDRQQADVALAYGIRNRGAHQTGAAPALWERFTEVRDAMFRTLSLTIDTLYP